MQKLKNPCLFYCAIFPAIERYRFKVTTKEENVLFNLLVSFEGLAEKYFSK